MFSRRGFLSTIMGSTAAAGTPIADPDFLHANLDFLHERAAPLQLLSPKDAFVLSVAVSSGSIVKAGDAIFQLDTDNEDRSLEQIALALALLALEDTSTAFGGEGEAPPTPMNIERGQILGYAAGNTYSFPNAHPLELRLLALQRTADVAQAYLDFAQDKQAATAMNNEGGNFLGGLEPNGPAAAANKALYTQSAAAVATAFAEVYKANIALARFQLAVTQIQQKQGLVKAQLANEQNRITKAKARLTITAPVAGKITLATTTGCFVKLGHVMAEITA